MLKLGICITPFSFSISEKYSKWFHFSFFGSVSRQNERPTDNDTKYLTFEISALVNIRTNIFVIQLLIRHRARRSAGRSCSARKRYCKLEWNPSFTTTTIKPQNPEVMHSIPCLHKQILQHLFYMPTHLVHSPNCSTPHHPSTKVSNQNQEVIFV